MLDEKDKEWIVGAISGAIMQTVPGIVDQRLERVLTREFESQKVWFSNELKTQLTDGLDQLRRELTDVMREGFSECASAKQVVELGGSLDRLTGYVEEVRELVAEGFAECASANQLERVGKKIERVEINMASKTDLNQYVTNEHVTHKKQSNKFAALVEVLRQERVVSTRRANVVLAMEPHPAKLKE